MLLVTAPSFRPDLVEEMDLIEEVARIYGYEHVPATVPGHITGSGRLAPELAFENRVRNLLASAGLFEALTFTLDRCAHARTDGIARRCAGAHADRRVAQSEIGRVHPSPSLHDGVAAGSLRNNARRSIADVQLFEIGRIFRTTGGGLRFNYAPTARWSAEDVRVQQAEQLPLEQRSVGIALMGRPWTTRWGGGEQTVDFFWLKGLLEQFLGDLGVADVTVTSRRASHAAPRAHGGNLRRQTVLWLFGEYTRAWRIISTCRCGPIWPN